jgi:hypothetical protein
VRSTSLDALELAKDNRNKVLRDHKGHQNRSKAFLAVVGGIAESEGDFIFGGTMTDGKAKLV